MHNQYAMEAYNNEPTEEYDQYWLDDDTDGDQGGGRVSMLVPRKLNFPSFADSVFDTKQKLQVFVRLRPTEKPTCVSTHDTDQALLRAVVKGKDTLYRSVLLTVVSLLLSRHLSVWQAGRAAHNRGRCPFGALCHHHGACN